MTKPKKSDPTETFRLNLEKLDLTITGAAPYLGLSPRQLQRIAAGAPVPKPVAKLIRVAIKYKIPLEVLADG